jgi:hypothetical protein
VAELTEVIEALVVRPGDKLIVRVDPRTTRAQADEMIAAVKERLPELEILIVAAEQLAVLRG